MESFQVILDSGGAFPKENPFCQIGVSKNSGYPKMDGENNGNPY